MALQPGVQPLGLSKLTKQVTSQADASKERGRAMLGHRDAYSTLQDKLHTLSDTMRHQVMVPFTSKAFMPGQLVHTNEILVLLGDNWFVETSAKHAAEIAGRRVAECDKMLQKVEEEVNLIEGWQKRAGAIGKEHEECVDIREDFEEDKEKEWKDKHKKSVKKEKEKGNTQVVDDDEDMWRRLEELEVQEALEKEWEDEESSEVESDTEEESDLESDDDDEECSEPSDPENDGGLSFTNLGSSLDVKPSKKKVGRRVSWAGMDADDGMDSGTVIKFTHSSQSPPEEILSTDPEGVPHTPADLPHFVCQQPKSILKHTDAEILIREVPEPEQPYTVDNTEQENLEPAMQETVLERAVCDKPFNQPEEPKRVSKFKASRLKGKE